MLKYKSMWLERVKAIAINLSTWEWKIANDKFVLNQTDGACLKWFIKDGGWIPCVGDNAEEPEADGEYLILWAPTNKQYRKKTFVDILEYSEQQGFIDTLNRDKTVGGFEVLAWQPLPKLPRLEEFENDEVRN